MNQQNKTLPAEYVPVVNMIQKEESIRRGINSLKEKILVSAGDEFQSWPDEKQNQFLERTVVCIAKDEKLADCFKSPEGKLSIIGAVEKAVSTGLQIGGKHAYLVPQPKKTARGEWIKEVRFSIRDRGYYALLCGGKKPIFKDLSWGIIRTGDDCRISKATGEVIHNVAITGKIQEYIGCWVRAEKLSGKFEADFFPKEKIEQWRNSSKAYQDAITKKYTDTPWLQWPEEMALQSSIRHFCERYEEARELLASALYDDETEKQEKTSVENIDDALRKTEPWPEEKANQEMTPEQVEKDLNKKTESEDKEDEKKELDLF